MEPAVLITLLATAGVVLFLLFLVLRKKSASDTPTGEELVADLSAGELVSAACLYQLITGPSCSLAGFVNNRICAG